MYQDDISDLAFVQAIDGRWNYGPESTRVAMSSEEYGTFPTEADAREAAARDGRIPSSRNRPASPRIAGRLKVHALGDANEYCLISDDHRWVMALKMNGEFLVSQQEEIIRRIIACVNECDGVSLPDLEGGKVRAALGNAGFL